VGPIGGIVLEPEQLGQVFGAAPSPAAALALEAASDVHFDVLFITPLPLRTGASLRPMERRSEEGIKCQLSIPSRLPRM
jgi:hypothetical protein